MKIKYIVAVTSSVTDVMGNRSHFATITSTRTGKQLKIADLGGPGNVRHLLAKHWPRGADINEPTVFTVERTLGVRDHAREAKRHANGAYYEHQVTAEILAAIDED